MYSNWTPVPCTVTGPQSHVQSGPQSHVCGPTHFCFHHFFCSNGDESGLTDPKYNMSKNHHKHECSHTTAKTTQNCCLFLHCTNTILPYTHMCLKAQLLGTQRKLPRAHTYLTDVQGAYVSGSAQDAAFSHNARSTCNFTH